MIKILSSSLRYKLVLTLGSLGRGGQTLPTTLEERVDRPIICLLKHLKRILIFQGVIRLDMVFLGIALGLYP